MVDTPISGATASTYTLVAADVGHSIYCRVTGTNSVGSSSANSNTVGPVTESSVGPPTTNLWLWLKADSGVYTDVAMTTPATAENDFVRGWHDNGGGNRNFTQAATTGVEGYTAPLLKLNVLNSKPALFFSDMGVPVSRSLNGPDAAALTAGEIFIIVKATDATPSGVENALWNFDTSGQSTLFPYLDENIYDGWGSTTRKNTGNPTLPLDAWRLYNVVSTSAEWTSFLDNVQHFTTATNTVGFPATTKLSGMIASDGFPGHIAEVVMYSAKCSVPDKLAVVTYLSDKYALGIV